MQIPTTPEAVAAAMDCWEDANGTTDLYDELVTHLGPGQAGDIWGRACNVYDATHATPPVP